MYQGVKSSTGVKVSFFEFPNQPLLRKKWIHAIRQEEGKNWHITGDTKVCSLHFRREDLRKSLVGRTYVVPGCVPSRFAWSVPSPRKRKAPTERLLLPVSSKKQLFTSDPPAVQVEPTKQMSQILALRVTWKWIKERKSRI